MICRDQASVTLHTVADLTGKEGVFVKPHTDGVSVDVIAAATDVPLGIVNSEAPAGSSTAEVLISDAFAGTTRVKLGATPGTVKLGVYGALNADGTVSADPGTGARVIVCRFLETGAGGERVEAVIFKPVPIAAA